MYTDINNYYKVTWTVCSSPKIQTDCMDAKIRLIYICSQETDFDLKLYIAIHRLKLKEWEKVVHVNGTEKKAGISILISDKTDFEKKTTESNKGGYCIMIKESTQ